MNKHQGKEKLTLNLKYIKTSESGKAILVTEGLRDSEGKEINHWLPVSQVDFDEDELEPGKTFDIEVPRWLIEEKELTI